MYLHDGDWDCHSPDCEEKATALTDAAKLVKDLADMIRALAQPSTPSLRMVLDRADRFLEDLPR